MKRVGLFSEEPDRSIVSQPTWSPDGQKIAFVGVADGVPTLYTIGRNGSELREVVELENSGFLNHSAHGLVLPSVFWSRDGLHMMLSWGNTLHLVNADGSDLQSTHVHLVNADGSDLQSTPRGAYFSPSPDGLRIAVVVTDALYLRHPKTDVVLYSMVRDGTGVQVLVRMNEEGLLEAVNR